MPKRGGGGGRGGDLGSGIAALALSSGGGDARGKGIHLALPHDGRVVAARRDRELRVGRRDLPPALPLCAGRAKVREGGGGGACAPGEREGRGKEGSLPCAQPAPVLPTSDLPRASARSGVIRWGWVRNAKRNGGSRGRSLLVGWRFAVGGGWWRLVVPVGGGWWRLVVLKGCPYQKRKGKIGVLEGSPGSYWAPSATAVDITERHVARGRLLPRLSCPAGH